MKPSLMPLHAKNISGEWIRTARLARQRPMTQGDLAERLAARGLTTLNQAAISRIESGERGVQDYELKAIALCLKTTVGWLCGEKRAKRSNR